MARRLRLQYAGAIYHVINRGNYRRDVFETPDKAKAFERCLFETCDRMRWGLHAYALMRNHYHLAIETPQPNLVAGMHWLQSTFATRFNRFRQERGHLFQGRYQALAIKPGPSLGRVAHYIHLNPVRAGIVAIEQISNFRWSSLRLFVRGGRPACLSSAEWLPSMQLEDTVEGWRHYCEFLASLAIDPVAQSANGFESMTRGWAIGTAGWRAAMAEDHAHLALTRGIPPDEVAEINEAHWRQMLNQLLRNARKTPANAAGDRRGAEWKIEIAQVLRKTTTAPNSWIADALCMGAASSVSQYLSLRRRQLNSGEKN